MAISYKQQKYLTPVIHVLFWMLLFFLPVILRLTGNSPRMPETMQLRLLLNNIVLIGFFYLNAYLIYPKVYKKKGLILYIISIIVTVALLYNVTRHIEREYLPFKKPQAPKKEISADPQNKETPKRKHWDKGNPFLYYSLFPYIFILGISISYRVVRDSSKLEKLRKEQENETLKTELTFLRSQVSPHFMFNVLNTLVSMARKKSDMMEPSLIKLSNLMRYMLYESNEEKISLEQEIQYLGSYIDLQMLRFGDDLDLRMNIASNIDGYEIEPMLLIAFVENAFKHGVGMVEEPFIDIKLNLNRSTHWLEFVVENSIAPTDSARDKSSGIGLSNMRRRLELLYKDRYKLDTNESGNTFISKLSLHLK